jgi:hypothetical protein
MCMKIEISDFDKHMYCMTRTLWGHGTEFSESDQSNLPKRLYLPR